MRRAPVLAIALALAGCGGDGEGGSGYVPPLGADGRPAPLGCEHAVPTTAIDPPPELILPASSRVLVTETEPSPGDSEVTIVRGYLEEVPSGMIARFEEMPEVKVLFSEDEEVEAEVLVADGPRRNYWTAVRTCLSGSLFATAVGPADAVGRTFSASPRGRARSRTHRGR